MADSRRIFINRVPQNVTNQDVAAHFAQFGPTTDVYLPSIPGQQGHKGIAYVTFADPQSSQLCLAHLQHVLGGATVTVEQSAPRDGLGKGKGGGFSAPPMPALGGPVAAVSPAAPPAQEEGGECLCINNIPQTITREDMTAHFCQFGQITDLRMPPAAGGGPGHRGLCLIGFAEQMSLVKVLMYADKQPHTVCGHPLVADIATPSQMVNMGIGQPVIQRVTIGMQPEYKGFGSKTFRRVFLSKVTPEIDEGDLRKYFSQFGDIEDVFRPANGTKGVAFVKFRFTEPAQAVVQVRNHYLKEHCLIAGESMDRPPSDKGGGKGDPFMNSGAGRFSPY